MNKLIPALVLPAAAVGYLILEGALQVGQSFATIVASIIGFGGLAAALYFAWRENNP